MNTTLITRAFFSAVLVQSTLTLPCTVGYAFADHQPPLQLAETLDVADIDVDLSRYYYAEKLDGVRGFWNGQSLLTRQGNPIQAPEWFLDQLPWFPVEGELWLGRGLFDELSGLVRQQTPDDHEWRKVRFMLFDLPGHAGRFVDRRSALENWVRLHPRNNVHLVELHRYQSNDQLLDTLEQWQSDGAEGIMLYNGDGYYHSRRSQDLLKLKGYQDDEAVVVGYLPGKGKYEGVVGSLLVENSEGVQFKVGSGLTDNDRANPPDIGATITYRYNGLTTYGKPRFARYERLYRP